jgi:G3E family GTPase
MQASGSKIPVTLITGSLSAGKTILLNHLIREV